MVKTDLFKTEFIAAPRKSDRLMIVLHGKGDSVRPFRSFNEELKIPQMNYLLINAPKKFLTGYSWYGDPPYEREGVLRMRAKMFQLLAELKSSGWKTENIFFLGFSQGCLVSADVAMNYPGRLGGVIGISGYFHFFPRWRQTLKQNRETPWLLTHGHRDDVLSFEETKFGVEKLRSAGLQVDFVESDKKHVFEEKEYPVIRKWVQAKIQEIQISSRCSER